MNTQTLSQTLIDLISLVSELPVYGPPHLDVDTQSVRLPAPVKWDPVEDRFYREFDTFRYYPFRFEDGEIYCAVDCETNRETQDGFFMGWID